MLKKALLLIPVLLFALPLKCMAVRSDTHLIDIPTAEILPARSFGINARMFGGGGVLTYLEMPVLSRLSIGASLTAEHLIGTNEERVKLLTPAVQAKFRFYDGSDALPAFAIGFDNQGFAYDRSKKEYIHTARGAYLVATKEIITQGLVINPGLNISVDDFEFYRLAAFAGASYNIKDAVSLMFEWDNIRSISESRLNGGLRVYIYNNFALDFALRSFNHRAERILQLRYSFSI